LERVEARILYWKEKIDAGVKEYNLQENVDRAIKAEAEKKLNRKNRDVEKKRRKMEKTKEADAEFELDKDVAKMMGIAGFKSSKK
jgi:uncharacterized membrane protein YheB (UPF0754 family)